MAEKDDKDSKKPPAEEVDEEWDDDEEETRDSDAPENNESDDDEGAGDSVPAAAGNPVERAASRAAEAHDHGLAHITPVKLLVGVFGALVVFTVATVAVTSFDLGSQGNFIVAMIIATIKAGLVMAFFMHLVWDRKFNLTVFLSAFLFVLLFLSLSLTDRSEYQDDIDAFEQNNPIKPVAAAEAPAGEAPAAEAPAAAH